MTEHASEHPDIHMPSPSYWPLALTAGLTFFLLGIVFSFYLSGLGLVIFLISLVGWLREPTGV